MSYKEALRVAITNELCSRQLYGEAAIHPNDIEDVKVRWDSGDRCDPTYGDSPNAAPTFEIEVTLKPDPSRSLRHHTVDVEVVFGALLKAVLETGL